MSHVFLKSIKSDNFFFIHLKMNLFQELILDYFKL